MNDFRYGGHTVSRLTVNLVWVTKYRHKDLEGDVQKRWREFLIQICDSEDVQILSGVVSKDHVHMHVTSVIAKSQQAGEMTQGKKFPVATERVLSLAKTLLGKTFVSHRVWRLEHRQHYGRGS